MNRPTVLGGGARPHARVLTWRNRIGYPAQPGLIRLSVRPSVCTYLQIRYSAENGTGPTDSVNYSSKS
jgi:hypothetical protein